MHVTYDVAADAVYIRLKDWSVPGDFGKMYACDPVDVDGMINLNFDKAGRLYGIEVLDASRKLPEELLALLRAGPVTCTGNAPNRSDGEP